MLKARALVFAAFVVGLAVVCVGCAPPAPAPVVDTSAQDQAAIRALEDKFAAAFNAKDVNGIMALYSSSDDLVVFDVVPPQQYTGWAAYKKDWDDTFAAFPGPVVFQVNDLAVTVGGDVAYSHSIQSATMTDAKGKKFSMTVRVTDGYKKVNGQWLIAHEHASIPVDLATMKAIPDSK
jgi:uncharacterized protein (TIGR02246 family)